MVAAIFVPSADMLVWPAPPFQVSRPRATTPVACVQRKAPKLPSLRLPATTDPLSDTESGKPPSKRYSNVTVALAGAAASARPKARTTAFRFFILVSLGDAGG